MSSLPTDLSLGRRDFLKGSLLAGGGLFQLINPELARGHSDYTRNYHCLELARMAALMAAAAGALALWLATCMQLLKARQRSIG